tara:strand:+ start:913 stop:1371 length:459 start_codon:yes stop_codon:yes gene_type:complete
MTFYGALGAGLCIWSITPFIDKMVVTRAANILDMAILRYILSGFIGLFIAIVTLRGKKVFNYENKILVYTFLLSIISFIAIYIWFYLITNFDAAFTMAIINPITIITTMILGYLFFNEEITHQQVLGTIIVTIGLVVLIMGKSKQVKKLGKN